IDVTENSRAVYSDSSMSDKQKPLGGSGAVLKEWHGRPAREDTRKMRVATSNCITTLLGKTLAKLSARERVGYHRVPTIRRGSIIGNAAVLKTAARKGLQVRVLSPPPFLFNNLPRLMRSLHPFQWILG